MAILAAIAAVTEGSNPEANRLARLGLRLTEAYGEDDDTEVGANLLAA